VRNVLIADLGSAIFIFGFELWIEEVRICSAIGSKIEVRVC